MSWVYCAATVRGLPSLNSRNSKVWKPLTSCEAVISSSVSPSSPVQSIEIARLQYVDRWQPGPKANCPCSGQDRGCLPDRTRKLRSVPTEYVRLTKHRSCLESGITRIVVEVLDGSAEGGVLFFQVLISRQHHLVHKAVDYAVHFRVGNGSVLRMLPEWHLLILG